MCSYTAAVIRSPNVSRHGHMSAFVVVTPTMFPQDELTVSVSALLNTHRSSASSLLRDLATLAYYFCIVGVATLFIWNNIYLGEGKGAAAVAVLLGLDAGEWAGDLEWEHVCWSM